MEDLLSSLPTWIEGASLGLVGAITFAAVSVRKSRQALSSGLKRVIAALKKLREAIKGPTPMALLAVVLVGCAGSQTPQKAHLTGCAAYDSTLRVLAAYREAGELSESQVDRVNELRPILNDLCSGPSKGVDEVVEIVDRHVTELVGIKQEAKE